MMMTSTTTTTTMTTMMTSMTPTPTPTPTTTTTTTESSSSSSSTRSSSTTKSKAATKTRTSSSSSSGCCKNCCSSSWWLLLWESYRNHVISCSIHLVIIVALLMNHDHYYNYNYSSSPLLLSRTSSPPPSFNTTTITSIQHHQHHRHQLHYHHGVYNVLSLCLLFVIIWSFYLELRYIKQRIGLPPGDSGYPIFGHLHQLISIGPSNLKIIKYDKFQQQATGSSCSCSCSCNSNSTAIITLNILMNPCVMFKDTIDIRWWLIQERKGNIAPYHLPHITQLVGQEAILFQSNNTSTNTNTSNQHRRLRKIFEPSFSPQSIKKYIDIIDETIQIQLSKWSKSDKFHNSNEWSILAMRLFFVCAFPQDQIASSDMFLEKLSYHFHIWAEGFPSLIPYSIWGTKLYKAHKARNEMFTILKQMINDFKIHNPYESCSEEAKNSMMGRLCYGVDDNGRPLSDEQLITNITFILFAGHDTTKGSFCAFAHYLTEYPKAKQLLVEEVSSTKFQGPSLDIDELKNNAPILNAFLAETWRLMAPLSSHSTQTMTDINYKGYKFPKGTRIGLDIQAYQRSFVVSNNGGCDNDGYIESTKFILERWLPPNHPMHSTKYYVRHDYNVPSVNYRTFGFGSHMCLGAHFAKLEARVVLTRMLQKYDIDICNDKLILVPLLQYKNDFKITSKKE